MVEEKKYDFFVSRRGSVSEIAREVAQVLTDEGYVVLVQDYDIPVGASFIEAMHEGIKRARDLIVLLTRDYDVSPYTRKELTSFEAKRLRNPAEHAIIILRCENVQPEGLLADNVFQDLVGVDDPAERRRCILAAARQQAQAQKQPPRPFIGVPPRLIGLAGRADALDQLDDILLHDRPAAVTQAGAPSLSNESGRAAVFGMGGIGKTSLAAEYAHRYRAFYSGVCWCPAESRRALIGSLAALAYEIGAATRDATTASPDDEAAAQAGLRKLGDMRAPWLLIYDNVTSPDDIVDLLPASGARVLITSRFSDWSGWAEEIPLDLLRIEDAAALLQSRAQRTDPASAALLAEALGRLPLALEQAGAFCKAGISFQEYGARMTELIRMKPRGARYPNSVFATISLAFDKACAESPDAERFVRLLAFLAPDGLTAEMFPTSVIEPLERLAATQALAAVALIGLKDGHQISIHRLTQEVIRQRVHESAGFASIREALHKTLEYAFASVKPNCPDPMWDHLLWCVHHDPDPTARLAIWYERGRLDFDLRCAKLKGEITIHYRVLDFPSPLVSVENRYRLENGWKQVGQRRYVN